MLNTVLFAIKFENGKSMGLLGLSRAFARGVPLSRGAPFCVCQT